MPKTTYQQLVIPRRKENQSRNVQNEELEMEGLVIKIHACATDFSKVHGCSQENTACERHNQRQSVHSSPEFKFRIFKNSAELRVYVEILRRKSPLMNVVNCL